MGNKSDEVSSYSISTPQRSKYNNLESEKKKPTETLTLLLKKVIYAYN